jgi:hypothetical protein
MTQITQAQREALLAATQNPEGVIDTPADAKLAKSLIKKGWAISTSLAEGGERLTVTVAGRAITAEADQPAKDDGAVGKAVAGDQAKPARARGVRKSSTEWPTGKLGVLVTLLQRPEGANLAEMTAATGWQTHSVRGAMSGALKKGFGFVIDSQKTEAGRTYRIVADGAA